MRNINSWLKKQKEREISNILSGDVLSKQGRGYDYLHKNDYGYTSLSKRWKDLYKRATDYYNDEAYKGFYDAYSGTRGKEGYIGKNDAGRWYNDLEKQKNTANKGVDELLRELDQYSRYYNEDAVNYVRDLITQRQKSYDDVMTDAGKFRDHWSQWATEDDYNNAVWENDFYTKLQDGNFADASAMYKDLAGSSPDNAKLTEYGEYLKAAKNNDLINKYKGMSADELLAEKERLEKSMPSNLFNANPLTNEAAKNSELMLELQFVSQLYDETALREKYASYDVDAGQADIDFLRGYAERAKEIKSQIAAIDGKINQARVDGRNVDALLGEKMRLQMSLYQLSEEYRDATTSSVEKAHEKLTGKSENKYGINTSATDYYDVVNFDALLSQATADHNTAVRNRQSVLMATEPLDDPDFAEKSTFIPSERVELSWWEENAKYFPGEYGHLNSLGYGDPLHEYINGDDGVRSSIETAFKQDEQAASTNLDSETPTLSGTLVSQFYDEYGKYAHMTEDQKAIYNYYYNTQGKEAAARYLNSIEEYLNASEYEDIYERLKDKPTIVKQLYSIPVGLDQVKSGLAGIFSEGYTPASPTQMTGQKVREDLADEGILRWYNIKTGEWEDKFFGSSSAQMLYDIGSTTSNMLPSILISAAIGVVSKTAGAAAGAALLGASAGGNAKTEMLNLGYSKDQANAYGLLVGASEAGLSYIMSGIPGLRGGDGVASGILTKILGKIDNALAKVAIAFGGVIDEGVEEGLQTVLEDWFKEIATGVDFEDPSADEILYSSLLGMLNSAGMNAGGAAINGIGSAISKQNTLKTEGGKYKSDPEVLINEALALDPNNEYALELKAKLESGEKISAAQLGKLSFGNIETVGKTLTDRDAAAKEQANKELVTKTEKRLSGKIENTETRVALAESLAKAIEGEHVSNAEIRKIAKNQAALNVLNDELGTRFKTGNVKVSDVRQAISQKQSNSTRLSSENILSTYSAFYDLDEAAERSLMVNYAADVKNAENGKAINPEDYAAVYGLVYAAGKKGADVSKISADAAKVLSPNAMAQAYKAGQNAAKDADGGSSPDGESAVRSGDAQEFKGSVTGRTYSAEAAQLLSAARIGEIDSNKSYYTLGDLGISKAEQQAWIDAGIAVERKNAKGEVRTTVLTNVLKDELSRRENSAQKVVQKDGGGVTIEVDGSVYSDNGVRYRGEVNTDAAPDVQQAKKGNAIEPDRVVYSSKKAVAYDAISRDKLDAKQKKVVDVAAQIGRKVVFATTATVDGVEVDGFIAKNGDIYINPNKNVAPMAFVFKHEIAHFAERAGQKYQDFKNLVRKSEAFKSWLKEKGLTEQQYNAQLREERSSIGQKLDEPGATVEIISNFVGDMLFGDNNTISEDLIRELDPKQRKTVRDYIRDFFAWIKSKFVGDAGKAKFEVHKLEKAFGAAYRAAVENNAGTNGEQFSRSKSNFVEDKYYSRQIDKFDSLKQGGYIAVGEITEGSPLNMVGIPHGSVYFDVSKIIKEMKTRNDPLSRNIMKKIPEVLNNPTVITEYIDQEGMHSVNVYGNLFVSNSPVVVGVMLTQTHKGNIVSKIKTVHPNKDALKGITDKNVLYLSENKKETKSWFQSLGKQELPLGGNRFGFIRSISQTDVFVKRKEKNFSEGTEQFSYTPQDEKVASVFEQLRNGQISVNEAERLLKTPKGDDPASIASLKKEDMGTTPKLDKKTKGTVGDGDSKFAESVKKSSIFNDTFKKEVAEDNFVQHYASITNKETLAEAAKRLDDGGEAYVNEWLSKKTTHMDTVDTMVGFILLKRYQDAGDYTSAAAVAQKVREVGTLSGQRVQAFSIIGRFNPDMMQTYAQKELEKAWEMAVKNRGEEWARKNSERFNLTDEEISFIRDNILYAAKMPENSRERAIALAEITTLLQNKLPPAKGQSYKAWQRVSMLLNPKTQLRNVLGNAMMAPVFITSDWFSTPVDWLLSKKTGVRTTGFTGLHGNKANLKAAKKGLYESFDDWKRHINTKAAEQNRFEIGQGKSFDEKKWGRIAKIMNSFDQFTSFLLDAGDRPFYEAWFTNSLNEQMRLNEVSEPTEEMVQIAVDEALSRTWQDENSMTKFVSGVKKAMNHLQIGGYGVGDVIIKFTKTPANLTKAIYDFSPAAILSLTPQAVRLSKAIKNNTVTPAMQKKFTTTVGKMAAGSMLYIIFAAMYAAGHIKGSSDEDKDVAAFEKYVQGIPAYSIKIGDKWFSYDWAQPIGAVPAIIADFMESNEEGADIPTSIYEAFKAGGEVLFNQSFMTSLQTLFSADSFVEGALDLVLGEITVPIPTVFSQLANIFDENRRSTYDGTSEIKSALNRALIKIPGIRNMLEKEVDVLGRDVENSQKDWFNAFFNPANVYTDTSTDVTDHAYEIYQSTGDKAAIPAKAPYSVTLQGTTIKLDVLQRAQYQRVMGETASELIEQLLENDIYVAMNDEEKLAILKQVYSYASAEAKSQLEWIDDYNVINGIAPYITEQRFQKMSDEEKIKIVDDYIFSSFEGMETIESGAGRTNYLINKKTASLVLDATLRGDIEEAIKLIDGVEGRIETYGWSDADAKEELAERKTSIKSTLTRYWKEAYLYAYYKNNMEEQNRIFDLLVDLKLYGESIDVEKTLNKWIEDDEE